MPPIRLEHTEHGTVRPPCLAAHSCVQQHTSETLSITNRECPSIAKILQTPFASPYPFQCCDMSEGGQSISRQAAVAFTPRPGPWLVGCPYPHPKSPPATRWLFCHFQTALLDQAQVSAAVDIGQGVKDYGQGIGGPWCRLKSALVLQSQLEGSEIIHGKPQAFSPCLLRLISVYHA